VISINIKTVGGCHITYLESFVSEAKSNLLLLKGTTSKENIEVFLLPSLLYVLSQGLVWKRIIHAATMDPLNLVEPSD
jgi:hypothetical protein